MAVETLAILKKIIHQSTTNAFKVAQFIDCKSAKEFRGAGEFHVSPKAETSQRYRLFGDWTTHPKFGPQLTVQHLELERPTDIQGLIPFLSENVRGVGETTAKKLIQHLEVATVTEFLDVCKNQSERLYGFFVGRKKKIADAILKAMLHDEIFRSVAIFLRENDIPNTFVKKIFAKYGDKTIPLLMENPYRLIHDIRRVGFLKADAIGQKLGISPTSTFRIEAACIFALESALDDGHTCLPRDALVQKMITVLSPHQETGLFSFEFVLENLRKIYAQNKEKEEESFLLKTLQKFWDQKNVPLFYLPEIYHMENEVLTSLQLLLYESGMLPAKERVLTEQLKNRDTTFEKEFPTVPWDRLSEEQTLAVQLSLFSKFMILTGGPGCGKTFVLKSIFELQKHLGYEIALCAPTGLAAKRMTQSIGFKAYTLHKLLGLGQKKDPQEGEEYDVDSQILDKVNLVIVDESSMLSLDLFRALLVALGPNKKLILVGDSDQLPSVGAGNCLADLIGSEKIPVVKLTKIFRQSSESPIPTAAQQIIRGHFPQFEVTTRDPIFVQRQNMAFVPCTADQFGEQLLTFLGATLPQKYGCDPIQDCQLLVPMRKSVVGQENLNQMMQNHFNPVPVGKKSLVWKSPNGCEIRLKDKVIQTKNNYTLKVFNGDLGFCEKIEKVDQDLEITVSFGERSVVYRAEEKLDLQLCYAMTIHKSQGSEFPICVIPMFRCYYTMLDRNLLYTAVTRASHSVIIFGEEWALKKAVSTQNSSKRYSALRDLLCEIFSN